MNMKRDKIKTCIICKNQLNKNNICEKCKTLWLFPSRLNTLGRIGIIKNDLKNIRKEIKKWMKQLKQC